MDINLQNITIINQINQAINQNVLDTHNKLAEEALQQAAVRRKPKMKTVILTKEEAKILKDSNNAIKLAIRKLENKLPISKGEVQAAQAGYKYREYLGKKYGIKL